MFAKLITRGLTIDWRFTIGIFLVLAFATFLVVTNLHLVPAETYVALNWASKASGGGF